VDYRIWPTDKTFVYQVLTITNSCLNRNPELYTDILHKFYQPQILSVQECFTP
jgi:hypothetical protein